MPRNARIRFPRKSLNEVIHFCDILGERYVANILRDMKSRISPNVWVRETKTYGRREYVRRDDAREQIGIG